tara:strand:+ start:139 stop:2391 length:2253 start_codon:yes stop_codon:yes gene_type:complete
MLNEKPQNTVNRATKDILAKCMATEDLRVIHDVNAETAYFDTKNRVLCLPIWRDMTNSMYDMLVGHEVSHALHTPQVGWESFVGEGRGSGMRHMFLNVVEDARIERMIKDKFPGIRRDFATAYKEFSERDLFELKNRTIDTDMPLIDRLNLHFKLGLFGLETIPFLDNEKQYVTRMGNTVTFDDVVQLAKELYEQMPVQDEEDEDGSQTTQGDSGQSGDDRGESQDGSQSNSDSESGDGQDSGQSMDDDTDDGEGADSESGDESGDGEDGQSGDAPSGLDYDDYQDGGSKAGSTQKSFEQNVNRFRKSDGNKYEYHTLPTMKIENCVVDYKTVRSIWNDFESKLSSDEEYPERYKSYLKERENHSMECAQYLNKIKSTVANMVQQFQMKQAADAEKKTDIAKTGILDTVGMINYRWSEDIFLKNEVHPDAKNHGIVMYIDWSGSMCGIIKDTVEQLLVLTEFCKKVNIPFDVYAFTSRRYSSPELLNDDGDFLDTQYVLDETDNELMKPHCFSLIQYLSSDMKNNEYKLAVEDLYSLAINCRGYYGSRYPRAFDMGCTPLNEAVVSAIQMVPAFQAKHGVQIVNTVFLSDGDGHSMGASRCWGADKSIIHDPKTRRDYEMTQEQSYHDETSIYLQILQERTGTNLIGIRLHDNKQINNIQYRYWNTHDIDDQEFTQAKNSWRKHNFATVDGQGYDRLFIVKGNLEVETDLLEGLDDDVSYTKLKNAFMKGSSNVKSSRVIASQMVDIIAT